MNDSDLNAIEARAKRAWEAQPPDAALDEQVICQDVPALIAEVRRLRANTKQVWAATREVERMAYDGQSAVRMVRDALDTEPQCWCGTPALAEGPCPLHDLYGVPGAHGGGGE